MSFFCHITGVIVTVLSELPGHGKVQLYTCITAEQAGLLSQPTSHGTFSSWQWHTLRDNTRIQVLSHNATKKLNSPQSAEMVSLDKKAKAA